MFLFAGFYCTQKLFGSPPPLLKAIANRVNAKATISFIKAAKWLDDWMKHEKCSYPRILSFVLVVLVICLFGSSFVSLFFRFFVKEHKETRSLGS